MRSTVLALLLLAGGAQAFAFAPHAPGTQLLPRLHVPPASSPRAAGLTNNVASARSARAPQHRADLAVSGPEASTFDGGKNVALEQHTFDPGV